MIPGFSRLSVRGYRRLKAVDVPLRRLNVLIGANGVGKTSILDVFNLLGVSANRRLAAAVVEAGGLQSILTADGTTTELDVQLAFQTSLGESINYELSLTEAGLLPHLSIGNERLFKTMADTAAPPITWIDSESGRPGYHDGSVDTEPDKNYNPSETALSQAPYIGSASGFRAVLGTISAIYHGLDVSTRAAVRRPQTLSPTPFPGPTGEDLAAALFTIRETAHEHYEMIEDSLRAAFPSFERLQFPPVAARGLVGLGWRDANFTRPLYASELSEGTLRFLWLATLLQSPELPTVILIDEPEVSLHPELLRILTELMRGASEQTQLIVATHSDRFVRFLRPEEIIVCDLDEAGCMTTQWADELDLKSWLEDYTLDQLWSKGILGGRAWPSELR